MCSRDFDKHLLITKFKELYGRYHELGSRFIHILVQEFVLKMKHIRLDGSLLNLFCISNHYSKSSKIEDQAAQIFTPYCPSRFVPRRVNILKNRTGSRFYLHQSSIKVCFLLF